MAFVFASLTGTMPPRDRTAIALRGTAIALVILLAFAVFGEAVLRLFGISLAALRIGGGVLLLLIAIDMVFARTSGASSATPDETREAAGKADISTFPLATPLIAGPGAMGAVVLLMADTGDDYAQMAAVIGALLAVLAFTLFCMLAASQVQKLLGRTGAHVIARVFGVLLAGLAIQFMLDGLKQSGLFA